MTTKLKLYFDTNVFIEVIKNKLSLPLTHSVTEVDFARDLFQLHRDDKIQVVTSIATISEVTKVDGSPADGQTQRVKNEIHGLLCSGQYCHLLSPDYSTMIRARDLIWSGAGRRGMDGIHLASAVQHRCDEFVTFDGKDFQRKKEKIDPLGITCIVPSESKALEASAVPEEGPNENVAKITNEQMELLAGGKAEGDAEEEQKEIQSEE